MLNRFSGIVVHHWTFDREVKCLNTTGAEQDIYLPRALGTGGSDPSTTIEVIIKLINI